MNSGFYIFITVVRAPSGLVTTSTQPASLQGGPEAVMEAAGGGKLSLAYSWAGGVQIMTPSATYLLQWRFTVARARPCADGQDVEMNENVSLLRSHLLWWPTCNHEEDPAW